VDSELRGLFADSGRGAGYFATADNLSSPQQVGVSFNEPVNTLR